MIRLEMSDKELSDGVIVITIKNWSDGYSKADLQEWVDSTYGNGWRIRTLIPPKRPARAMGFSRPRKTFSIVVRIEKR